jgi:putative flippase GtrA
VNKKLLDTAMLREYRGFFVGATMGLSVDVALYSTLVLLTVPAGPSNFFSSGLSVLVVYMLLTKNVFKNSASPKRFLLFITWYVCSISAASLLIDFLHLELEIDKFLCKLIVVPLSFMSNFFIVRRILSGAGGPS